MATAPSVKTASGNLEGSWEDGVASFLGVPYAAAPVGDLRWAAPVAAPGWEGTRTATERGLIPPQPPSRLEAVMGPMQAPAIDEDCLNLNVWTPAPGSSEGLPTLVFIHGGGYSSGSGSAAWHDGRALAARGPAVIVTINYRLGALGYLLLTPEVNGGEAIANFGLLDQRLALEWVRSNAAAFGGDPENITVFGQSGGGHSVFGLTAMADTDGLFSRAILQSAPLGMAAASAEKATASAALFRDAAGVADGGLAELRALPLKKIFEAQKATMMASFAFGAVEPPFQLVTDGTVLATEPVAAAIAGSADGVDLLIGFTRDDATPFFCADDAVWGLDEVTITSRLAAGKGEAAATRLRAYIDRSESIQPAAALAQMISDEIMISPAIRLAEQRLQRGVESHLFRFSWAPESGRGRLGACHTIELPFVFGDFSAWTEAPMLGEAQPEDLAGLTAAVQDAWISFAMKGEPGHPGLGDWGPFNPNSASTMDLDLTSALVEDPSDGRRDLWA